ncbi:MAG: hypothetical protein WCI92_13460 [Bacteroidota bacterium]
MDIQQKKKARFNFLNRLYEITNGDSSYMESMWTLGKELNFERSLTSNIVDYLIEEKLIESRALGGVISITHEGIVEIEELHTNPDSSSEHFPAIHMIHIENMTNSAIQQGVSNSNQTIVFNGSNKNDLVTIIRELEAIKDRMFTNSEKKEEFEAELSTLKSQIKSPIPKQIIITESLKTIRNLIEGIAGNILAPSVLQLIRSLI